MGLLKNVGAGFGFPEALPETRYGAFFNSAIFVFTRMSVFPQRECGMHRKPAVPSGAAEKAKEKSMKLPFIEAGEIVNTHGVRGEVKLLPWLDSPESMCAFHRCRIGKQDYSILSCRVQNTCNLMRLEGVDTMEKAQALRGKTVEIYREDVEDGVIFAAELIGMQVYSQGNLIGELTQVLDYPGNQVYVVKGEREYMIPAVKAFILSTDLEKNEMQVTLLEGMQTDAD